MKTQVCRKCGVEKTLSSFGKDTNRPNHRTTCKECRYKQRDRESEKHRHREYMKQRRKDDPVAVRINWERSVYGVAKEDIGATECQICGSQDRLCIDHDHGTGAVRGILCTKCNAAIGMMGDSIDKLQAAIVYLRDGPHFQLPWKKYP